MVRNPFTPPKRSELVETEAKSLRIQTGVRSGGIRMIKPEIKAEIMIEVRAEIMMEIRP